MLLKLSRWAGAVSTVVLALCAAPAQAAPMLQVDATTGQLTGALGVDVNGKLYDVEFLDGTCAALFAGCDSAADFAFRTSADAQAASAALLSQVFVGSFDSTPALTRGCSGDRCAALTPFDFDPQAGQALVSLAFNFPNNLDDQVPEPGRVLSSLDTSTANGSQILTFSVWRPASTVPTPGTLALVAVAAMALVVQRRRGRQRL